VVDDLRDVTWLADYSEDGAAVFRIGRRGEEVIAEWKDTARLVARHDGVGARLEAMEGVSEDDLEKIRNGSAVLLVRHLEGKLAMHGAVVAEGDRAVALLGRSGHGKSTLAAAVCAEGAVLYADDAIAVDPADGGAWLVLPLERQHWLDARARSALGDPAAPDEAGKRPFPAQSAGTVPARLVAIVDLCFDESEPNLRRISGLDAMASLVPQAVRFALDDGERHKRELEMLTAIVSAVPMYCLGRRRDFALLPSAVRLVRQLLRADFEAR
jgi:hypothetical protein